MAENEADEKGENGVFQLDKEQTDYQSHKKAGNLNNSQNEHSCDINLNSINNTNQNLNSVFESNMFLSMPSNLVQSYDSRLKQSVNGSFISLNDNLNSHENIIEQINDDLIDMEKQIQEEKSNSRNRGPPAPRVCEICAKSFKYPSDLKKHEQTHTKIKRYECQYCQKSFRRIYQLNVHARIHTGEKPFACHICKMSFRHDSTLTMHIRTRHDHLRPYSCDSCQKTFGRSSHLRKHQKYVCKHENKTQTQNISEETTTNSSFVCQICHSVFFEIKNFLAHGNNCGPKKSNPASLSDFNDSQFNSSLNTCSICNSNFNNEMELKTHFFNSHPGNLHDSAINPQTGNFIDFQSNLDNSNSSKIDNVLLNPIRDNSFDDLNQESINSTLTKFDFDPIFSNDSYFQNFETQERSMDYSDAGNFISKNILNESSISATDIELLMHKSSDNSSHDDSRQLYK